MVGPAAHAFTRATSIDSLIGGYSMGVSLYNIGDQLGHLRLVPLPPTTAGYRTAHFDGSLFRCP